MAQVSARCGRKASASDRLARRFQAGLVALLASVAFGACSPSLDWRQLRPEGWGLAVALPCRPATHTRQVLLAGSPVELTLMACSVEGRTFGIASAELGDPARVGPALTALGDAARANVQGEVEAERPAQVGGMTPSPAARQWRLSGRLSDGRAVSEQVLVFAHGSRVFQATLVAAQPDDALAKAFFQQIEVLR